MPNHHPKILLWDFPKMVAPQTQGFNTNKLTFLDDLGYPYFRKTMVLTTRNKLLAHFAPATKMDQPVGRQRLETAVGSIWQSVNPPRAEVVPKSGLYL